VLLEARGLASVFLKRGQQSTCSGGDRSNAKYCEEVVPVGQSEEAGSNAADCGEQPDNQRSEHLTSITGLEYQNTRRQSLPLLRRHLNGTAGIANGCVGQPASIGLCATSGLPRIPMRFPVATVVVMVADGMRAEENLAEHPDLTREDIHESLLFAVEAVRERAIPLTHTA
jgi:uncharacterized protein (DUF433 family)